MLLMPLPASLGALLLLGIPLMPVVPVALLTPVMPVGGRLQKEEQGSVCAVNKAQYVQ
jgi:hypothetical protein